MAKVWKIAPGGVADHWDMCRQEHCIVIGWRKLKDYRKYRNKKQILKALGGAPGDGAGAAQSIWRFVHEIEPFDIVVANKGKSGVVGIGVVKSEYLPPSSPKNPSDSQGLPHARLVDWVIDQPIELGPSFFSIPTVYSLSAEKVRQIKEAYRSKYPRLKKKLDHLFDGISVSDDPHDSATNKAIAATEQDLVEQDAFDPTGITDARERILSSIVRRRGQPAFRKSLLAAYDGRCVVTGCDLESVLEAAHIIAYKGAKTNHPGNGLLLRADLHTLFDLRLLAVDVESSSLLVSPKLAGTCYARYQGKRLRFPKDPASQPNHEALEVHRQESGLSR